MKLDSERRIIFLNSKNWKRLVLVINLLLNGKRRSSFKLNTNLSGGMGTVGEVTWLSGIDVELFSTSNVGVVTSTNTGGIGPGSAMVWETGAPNGDQAGVARGGGLVHSLQNLFLSPFRSLFPSLFRTILQRLQCIVAMLCVVGLGALQTGQKTAGLQRRLGVGRKTTSMTHGFIGICPGVNVLRVRAPLDSRLSYGWGCQKPIG